MTGTAWVYTPCRLWRDGMGRGTVETPPKLGGGGDVTGCVGRMRNRPVGNENGTSELSLLGSVEEGFWPLFLLVAADVSLLLVVRTEEDRFFAEGGVGEVPESGLLRVLRRLFRLFCDG